MSDAPPDIPSLIDAAEEALYSRQDPAGCIELCDEGLGRAEERGERVELLLLKAEAELAAELDGFATRTLEELPTAQIDDPLALCDLGQLWWALGDDDRAGDAYARALELDDRLADAHYGLGLVREAAGDRGEMIRCFLRTLSLDAEAPQPEHHLSEDEFAAIAERAFAELPERARELLENVPILVDDLPDRHLVEEGNDPRLLGLFTGHSMLEQDAGGGQSPAITQIQLYQRNLERAVSNADELAAEIRITLLHETAHYFGLEDDDLHELGLG